MDAPTIETERLNLRGHRAEDFDALAAMWADPKSAGTSAASHRPATRAGPACCVMRGTGSCWVSGTGRWSRRTARNTSAMSGLPTGSATSRPHWTEPEGGWVFKASAHGRGLASEAVRGALGWMDQRFGRQTTTCIIDDENTASLRVAEKCGYREFARSEYKGSPVIQLRR